MRSLASSQWSFSIAACRALVRPFEPALTSAPSRNLLRHWDIPQRSDVGEGGVSKLVHRIDVHAELPEEANAAEVVFYCQEAQGRLAQHVSRLEQRRRSFQLVACLVLVEDRGVDELVDQALVERSVLGLRRNLRMRMVLVLLCHTAPQ